jgi:hypothetical protein
MVLGIVKFLGPARPAIHGFAARLPLRDEANRA